MELFGTQWLQFWILLFLVSCSVLKSDSKDDLPAPYIPADSTIALRNVAVISVAENGIEKNRTAILSKGRIQEIFASGTGMIPESAVIIEGSGKYLLPGLLDMHVHMHEEDPVKYVSHGITTVRNMWGTPNVQALISQIKKDSILGPEIVSASPGMDGRPPTWGYTQIIEDPEEALSLVKRLRQEGWPFLKVYNRLKPEVYQAVAEAAKSESIRFLGHAPFEVPIEDVLEEGQASVEHFTGYDRHLGGTQGFNAWLSIEEARIASVAEMTAQTDTWNCPTLVVLDALTERNLGDALREQTEQNRFKLLKSLYDHGSKLLLGTDSGVQLITPGASLYDEMEKFVEAGIPPFEVIRMATLGGAQFLGLDNQIGTVTVGKQADLVLTDKNPLEKIENISAITGTVVDGAWYSKSYFKE